MRTTHALILAAVTVPVTLGCSGKSASGAARDCRLSAADSVHLARGPVYRECHVDDPAVLDPRTVQLELLPAALLPVPNPALCLDAEVELVVGKDGLPEEGTWRLLRANQPLYGDAVMKSVPKWRYRPARINGENVRQIVRERRTSAVRLRPLGKAGGPIPPGPPNC